jgi:predicted nucleotidyltransferase
MNLSSPISSVIPGAKGEVLSILARTTEELTGNVIASLAGGKVSQTGANKALKTLVTDGLVVSRPAGKAILYRLNRDHVAAGAIVELSELPSTLTARIQQLVASWQHPSVAMALFGSAARGQATSDSDVDLLVIRPDSVDDENPVWSANVIELTEAVERWTGNRCEILEYSEAEFARLLRKGDSLIDNIRRDAIWLAGKSPRELTRASR